MSAICIHVSILLLSLAHPPSCFLSFPTFGFFNYQQNPFVFSPCLLCLECVPMNCLESGPTANNKQHLSALFSAKLALFSSYHFLTLCFREGPLFWMQTFLFPCAEWSEWATIQRMKKSSVQAVHTRKLPFVQVTFKVCPLCSLFLRKWPNVSYPLFWSVVFPVLCEIFIKEWGGLEVVSSTLFKRTIMTFNWPFPKSNQYATEVPLFLGYGKS